MKDGEREGGKPSAEQRESGKPSAERDGTRKPGPRDGEGEKKPGMRDGDRPRTGERDGEKPRTAPRDGEGMKKAGDRDGESPKKPSAESTRSTRSKESGEKPSGEVITMHVPASGDTILINGQERPLSGLRGFLKDFLPEHPGARVIVSGDADTPLKSLHQILDAVRDNGNKNVGIKAE
ncbi:MAG TPA: hypothetical protein DIT64_01740 [Verrucomicrobiales bacterium]|nr:hypothetical protein [Verrucomicrobiales bacterium]